MFGGRITRLPALVLTVMNVVYVNPRPPALAARRQVSARSTERVARATFVLLCPSYSPNVGSKPDDFVSFGRSQSQKPSVEPNNVLCFIKSGSPQKRSIRIRVGRRVWFVPSSPSSKSSIRTRRPSGSRDCPAAPGLPPWPFQGVPSDALLSAPAHPAGWVPRPRASMDKRRDALGPFASGPFAHRPDADAEARGGLPSSM
jgi:hypothetical protein